MAGRPPGRPRRHPGPRPSADDTASLEQAVVENLHRADLNALEEAAAYQQLIEEFDLTHEQVAARVGKSRAAVTNSLRLFQLPAGAAEAWSPTASSPPGTPRRCWARLTGPSRSTSPPGRRRGPDVRAGRGRGPRASRARRRRPRRSGHGARGRPTGRRPARSVNRDPGLLELEELLADFLDTRVAIQAGRGRGKLVVEFADLEDLERIYRLIATGPGDAEPSDSDDEVEALSEDSTST